MKVKSLSTDLSSDPLDVFEQLAGNHECCFLLETLADKDQPQTSGQSYIGVAPEHCFAAKGGKFFLDGQEKQTDNNPFDALSKQIKFDNQLPAGYIGGLVGYFSHEAIHHIAPSLSFSYPREFYDFEVGIYNDGLIFRPGKSPTYFYQDEANRLDLYKDIARMSGSEKLKIDFVGSAQDASRHASMVDKARGDIQNGRVFQVVLANRYEYKYAGDLLQLYKEL